MGEIRERIKELVDRIFSLNEELSDVRGERSNQTLGDPATEEQVKRIEAMFDIKLPNDYRAFLLLHNGWTGFSGANALLSTEEMLAGELHEAILELQEVQRETDDDVAEGFVFEASFGRSRTYFDVAHERPNGGIDVVYWRDEEIDRYPSFTAYLEGYLEDLKEMLHEEHTRLR